MPDNLIVPEYPDNGDSPIATRIGTFQKAFFNKVRQLENYNFNIDEQPEYKIVVRNRQSNINPGETIHLEIYFTGWGAVTHNKLQISYSNPDLVSNIHPGEVRDHVEVVSIYNGALYPQMRKTDDVASGLGPVGRLSNLSPAHFMKHPDVGDIGPGYPVVVGEVGFEESNSPLEMDLNTDSDCTPGDYSITLTLTYGTQNSINQDQKEISIHVNSFSEKYRKELEIIVALGGVAAVVSIVGPFLADILSNSNYWINRGVIAGLMVCIIGVVWSVDYIMQKRG